MCRQCDEDGAAEEANSVKVVCVTCGGAGEGRHSWCSPCLGRGYTLATKPEIAWYKENATVDEMLAHIAPKRK